MAGDDDIPFLDDGDLDRISKLLDAFESGRLNPSVPTPSKRPPGAPIETRLGQASSDIPALSYGTTGGADSWGGTYRAIPGGGFVTPYYLDTDDTPQPLVPTGEPDYTVYNLFPVKFYQGDWVLLIRDPISGQYFVVAVGPHLISSSASGGGGGNGVGVVTEVDCFNGLHVVNQLLTGFVNIGGTQYPVTFNLA